MQGGIGLIVRDFTGNCIGVQGAYFDGGMTKGIEVELECEAMLAAVTYAVVKGFSKVVFESDSQVLIKSINEQNYYVHWMNCSIVLDIKFLLSKLAQWNCVSVKRSANGVADKLAKKARILRSNFEFQSALPLEIQEWVDEDNNVIS
ncbi:uncharacterized protein LOC113279999 [Papaver somniferum]|uniref:uncharacterized protein LOC113279999 n=1 Tax=Papaver somniferum TaxID=3469 RepID=UPI000E6FC750|nr:uncharacterized protein LOC113279999 [Papaver somniferum]